MLFLACADIISISLPFILEKIQSKLECDKLRKKEENTDVLYECHGDLFSKSNTLIDSKYKASLMEQKLLNIVLSKLQKRQYNDEGETGGLVCSIKAAELRELLRVSGGSFYTQLNKAAAAMTSRTIGFVNDDIKTFKYISLISMAQYEKGTFTVKFNYELKKYLTQEAPFTVLDLPVILAYNSVYALRLHEILLSECYNMKKPGVAKYTKKEATKGHYKIEIGLSELKLSLGVVNAETSAVQKVLAGSPTPDYDKAVEKATEKSFSDWYEFRRKVIEVAVKEINRVDNGTFVSYEPKKAGHGGKVYAITFFVELGNKENEEEKKTEATKKSKSQLSQEEQFELFFKVKTLIKEELSYDDISVICKAAEYDIQKIEKAYMVASSSTNAIDNLVGFMIKAIKENYDLPVKKENGKKQNKFNNFHQRDYDFDEYERALLNRDQA